MVRKTSNCVAASARSFPFFMPVQALLGALYDYAEMIAPEV